MRLKENVARMEGKKKCTQLVGWEKKGKNPL
jgi:hypothetical protein